MSSFTTSASGERKPVVARTVREAREALCAAAPHVIILDIVLRGEDAWEFLAELKRRQDVAIEQNITTLRNRVDELGIAEPIVTRQAANRIVVQLPGVQDVARAKTLWTPGCSSPIKAAVVVIG